ncbi:MAG: TIGR00730 family Rossman fold protein [Alphaproteobacteria bacterium]|nr:TIGR00730 family Rossman fold protein [Alphaproteobacteria bacterium SS10]
MRSIAISGKPEFLKPVSAAGGTDFKPLFDLDGDYDLKTELAPHIAKANGYVILPGADPLLTTSLFIDYQFQAPAVRGKPLVIYSPDDAPSPYIGLIRTLRDRGFVHQPEKQFFTVAKTLDEIPAKLDEGIWMPELNPADDHEHDPEYMDLVDELNAKGADKVRPNLNVAVFTSASTKDPSMLQLARKTGQLLAENGYGMVFGGSNVSMMGQVAAGVHDRDGYVTGVTTGLFFGKELKVAQKDEINIDNIRIADDIYDRMDDMIRQSDALVVLPGGIGTVQEMLAVMHMRENDPSLHGRPVILYNEEGFWDDLQDVLKDYGYEPGNHFHVVDNQRDLDKTLERTIGRDNGPAIDATGQQPLITGDADTERRLSSWRRRNGGDTRNTGSQRLTSGPDQPRQQVNGPDQSDVDRRLTDRRRGNDRRDPRPGG